MLCCIDCGVSLKHNKDNYLCENCGRKYPINNSISTFLSEKHKEIHYPCDSFERLYQAESRNFWFRVRNVIIENTVRDYLPSDSRLIEVGCGTGFVSKRLKELGYIIECADLYVEGLRFSQKRDVGNAYYQFNLYDLLFIDEFDGVCAFDVLEHIEDDKLVLNNIYKSLKRDGFLFVTVPACKKLWSVTDEFAAHKRRYSAKELKEKVESAGFEIVKLSHFMTFLFPFIFISRTLSNLTSSYGKSNKSKIEDQIFSELEVSPILNKFFHSIFRLEIPFIQHINLPFGSSLLLVAKKRR
jgi:2-polyprenyl-3-methyl-5-hydroxy-6-metoxy-1,4-benzoquinol methylase